MRHPGWSLNLMALGILAAIPAPGCTDASVGPSASQARQPEATPAQAKTPQAAARPEASHQEAGRPETTQPDRRQPEAPQGPQDDEPMHQHPFPHRIKAPELTGGLGWINTAGPLELADLKGKFVLLDFWTYCCINCMHILPELKKLEAAYPNELVVIGVHSAKFENEQDTKNITDAVLRYEIEHPVVNDANHVIWQNYAVNSWPSLRIIDPEGNLVAGDSGEIPFEILDRFLKRAIPYYKAKGVLDETPLRFDLEAYRADKTPLRFPGKILADEQGGRLFIADSNHNRIVVTRLDGTLLETIGSGRMGADDGDFATATFNHLQGMALSGSTLYVADTENHLLRKVDLERKQVTTIAGHGKQGRNPWPGLDGQELPERFVGKPLETGLASPWALWVHQDALYIAMAGPHQIWKMPLDESEIGPYAGNGREDIVDGPLLPEQPYQEGFSSFAQPSGLASDGTWLYVADSEGSSIRRVPFDPAGEVGTVVGTSHLQAGRLFDFGDVDGQGTEVRLQHALGVVFQGGLLYVADTYNNKIKVIDPGTSTSTTLAGDGRSGREDEPARFDEPAGISAAGGKLYVADTNNHLIRTIDLETSQVATLEIAGLEPPKLPDPEPRDSLVGATQIELPPAKVSPSGQAIELAVQIELPPGYKMNPLAPMRYRVEAADGQGSVSREALGKPVQLDEPGKSFTISLPVTADTGRETLKVSLTYYYCQEGSEGLCKVGSVVWTLPIELDANAQHRRIPLELKVE
ncbi:MAG: thioredoxin-like domain-containing protein [Pirellulales bacterium]